ncbi:MAG: alpha/beta hydrolase [Actinomycetota bacterium]|nr:alpha/beta hydrolase [Actinomycetota bacterium]
MPDFISHFEYDWEEPRHAAFLERLGSFARLIRLDKRGTGLSDRHGGIADLETRMDDIRAVMDAVGSESAALFGYFEGGPLAILFTATYPDRVRALRHPVGSGGRTSAGDDRVHRPRRLDRSGAAARR